MVDASPADGAILGRRSATNRLALRGALSNRSDMTSRRDESWRPPVFGGSRTRAERALAALRRFFDLQAGSVWRDLSALLPQCSGVVVDVGSGAQPYRGLLGTNTSYIGIDIAEAKSQFGYETSDTIYFRGDRWPLEDRSADVILCTETLEHVADTARFLSEAARLVTPGGPLILTVPFAARYHFIPYDYWRFTPASLGRTLSMAGFSDIEVFARGNALTVACYKAMALMLPLVFSPATSIALRLVRLILGLVLIPLIVVLAILGNLSLLGRGGDDCLGYTAVAYRVK